MQLDEVQKNEIKRLIVTEKYSGVLAMNKTWFEEGLEKGLEKGEEKGRRATLQEMIEDRFGPLPRIATERLDEMSLPELISLRKAFAHAQSLSDLGLEK